MSISVLFRLKNVVKVDILFTGKCKTKLSMCYSLQTSADGRRPRPGPGASQPDTHTGTIVTVTVGRDIFCVVEVYIMGASYRIGYVLFA